MANTAQKWDYKVVAVSTTGLTAAIVQNALVAQGLLGWEVIFMQVVGTNLLVVMKKRLVL